MKTYEALNTQSCNAKWNVSVTPYALTKKIWGTKK